MRLLLWFLVVFAAAVGLAVLAQFNTGNVVLFVPPYRIDLSLNLFLFLLFLFFLLFYVLLRFVRNTRKLPGWVAIYRKQKRERDGNQALRMALKALYEGRFVQAERDAQQAALLPENAGCAALIGARAAHALRQFERRDEWLAKIGSDPSFKTARLVSAAELLVEEQQPKEALSYIEQLGEEGARHVHAQRFALKANQQVNNWAEVLRLVQSLDKHHAINPDLSERLRDLAYEDLFLAETHDAKSVRLAWNKVPKQDQIRPTVALVGAEAFSRATLLDEARSIVTRSLSSHWDVRLLRLYRQLTAEHGSKELTEQISLCEQWLKSHPSEDELALTLGALCLKQKLWGKAQQHLDKLIRNSSDKAVLREAYLLLAELNEALNKPEEAAQHYRESALVTESRFYS